MSARDAIAAEHVSHRFGRRQVLTDISFAVPAGQFAVLIGPNGAGKTTLLALLAGLYRAASGTLRLLGFDMRRHSAAALARTGIMFQQSALDLDLTVSENLAYHAALHGLPKVQALRNADATLARFGLGDRVQDTVRTLSGGQRRKVEIARALAHRPALLLLDEPTVGLDPASRKELTGCTRDLCRDEGVSVLWATHLLEEIDPSDLLLVLQAGRLTHCGPAAELCRGLTLADAFHAHLTDSA